ncbi:MAG TPA: hypothetical protein VGX91_10050 [Candidatus Cybelea sp.]|nr:hypothetical protein [Candidatus Cybelea sp.]
MSALAQGETRSSEDRFMRLDPVDELMTAFKLRCLQCFLEFSGVEAEFFRFGASQHVPDLVKFDA